MEYILILKVLTQRFVLQRKFAILRVGQRDKTNSALTSTQHSVSDQTLLYSYKKKMKKLYDFPTYIIYKYFVLCIIF